MLLTGLPLCATSTRIVRRSVPTGSHCSYRFAHLTPRGPGHTGDKLLPFCARRRGRHHAEPKCIDGELMALRELLACVFQSTGRWSPAPGRWQRDLEPCQPPTPHPQLPRLTRCGMTVACAGHGDTFIFIFIVKPQTVSILCIEFKLGSSFLHIDVYKLFIYYLKGYGH